jgi:predicted nucleic-acid-binding protein
MKITADTNVLLRACVHDDAQQSAQAAALLSKASLVAVSASALCEFVWVLKRGYKFSDTDIARAVRLLVNSQNVVCNRQAVDAGLAMLDAGGDFADGVLAFDGYTLGATEFVSFDQKAVALLKSQRKKARLLV